MAAKPSNRELAEKLLEDATDGEWAIILGVAKKMMGEGRKEYGPLDLATDARSSEDFFAEGRDELADAFFYFIAGAEKKKHE